MASAKNAQVTIYSTQTCPYCKLAKAFFKEHKVHFTEVDVGLDDKAAEKMIRLSGQTGVPVIDVNGTVIVGFDKNALKKALKVS